ncbi:Uncharacterised protein [Mycobacteroides abscessus subsp. abscessus]|nr:Uncharacterised protein [Mycobacteroides abscessus subsp. abscessus]
MYPPSAIFVFPKNKPPDALNRADTGSSRSATTSLKATTPEVTGVAATAQTSLTLYGIPYSGGRVVRLVRSSVSLLASRSTCSGSWKTNALSTGLTFSIRRSTASATSIGVMSRAAIRRDNSTAVIQHRDSESDIAISPVATNRSSHCQAALTARATVGCTRKRPPHQRIRTCWS